MPVFDYQCSECGKTYEVYHKVREIAEDVKCPQCGSANHKKMMSAPMVSVGSSSSKASGEAADSGGGCCCGGACGLN